MPGAAFSSVTHPLLAHVMYGRAATPLHVFDSSELGLLKGPQRGAVIRPYKCVESQKLFFRKGYLHGFLDQAAGKSGASFFPRNTEIDIRLAILFFIQPYLPNRCSAFVSSN